MLSTSYFFDTIGGMDRKSFLKGPLARARWYRLIAKFIDIALVLIGAFMYYPMGLILGIIYIAVSDSLYDGQSIGKRLMGFSVISLIDGNYCSFRQSLTRNIPFIVPLIFMTIPYRGWIFAAVFALPLVAMEIYFLFRQDTTLRLGDILADTTVIANDGTRLDLRKTKNPWFDSSPIPQ